jgi:GH43 family beta-xylosidase
MSDPYTISSDRVLISTVTYDWEKIGSTPEDTEGKPYINEGPFAIVENNCLYLAYSASGSWNTGYCIAFLKLCGNNPLDKEKWIKYSEPVLSCNNIVKGAGHCSIIQEEDKKLIFFHAWESSCEEIRWNTVDTWQAELIIKDDSFSII